MRRLSVLLSALVLSSVARADARLDAALSRMAASEKAVKTLQFNFTQTTVIKITNEEQVLKGKALFQRPASFRVEHLSPRPLTAVSDGKTLWMYNPGLNQVMTDKWENWSKSAGFPKGLGPFQEGAAELRKTYDVSYEGGNGKEDRLRFAPKDPGAWPYVLRVTVDADGLPVRTELESQSLKTVTVAEQVKVNPPLPDGTFNFKIPQGAEVLGTPAAEGTPK